MKRIICMILAASCVFFTGCNSILYNGNLKFKSFEPKTIPAYSDELGEIAQEAQSRELEEKYRLEGVNAFYILPDHEADPDKIIDFKVLDYTTDGRFVYSYLTPCYVKLDAKDETGLGTASASGKAPRQQSYTLEDRTPYSNVLVLMSYNPSTLEYTVFYSHVSQAVKTETVENTQASGNGDVGTITASAENDSIMANRLVKSEEYFIFDQQTAYVYDKNGKQVSCIDYSATIAQEAERLKLKAIAGLRKQMSTTQARNTVKEAVVTVSDVVMDGNYYVYIPISVELPSTNGGKVEDDVEDDEQFENSVYMTTVACYDLAIGGKNSEVVFLSKNESWEEEVALWQSICIDKDTQKLLKNGIFESEAAAKAYMKRYSMDAIKAGTVGGVPDDFSVFATSGSTLNMELAGVADLFSFYLPRMSAKNVTVGKGYQGTLCGLLQAAEKTNWTSAWSFLAYMTSYLSLKEKKESEHKNYFWKSISPGIREKMGTLAKGSLALAGQGNFQTVQTLTGSAVWGQYLLIPWLRPGAWNGKTNASPLPWKSGTLEAVFAYRTSFYTGLPSNIQQGNSLLNLWDLLNLSLSEVCRYCPVEIDKRYQSGSQNPGYSMKVTKYTPKNITRTFSYYKSTEEDEDEDEDEPEIGTLTEKLPVYPLEYQLVFPEKAHVVYTEEVDTGEMVAASGDLGAVYYMEVSSGDSDVGVSKIRYNDGYRDVLSDQRVPGKAIDAGTLYYTDGNGNETEVTAYVTDAGIQFYTKKGSFFQKGVFLTLEQLAQSPSSYGLSVLGAVTQTGSSREKELQVTEEQDEIIRQKTEEGVSADSYSAANISLLSSTRAVVSSVSDGLIMVNLDNGLSLQLKDGAYYGAFPYMDSRTQGRRFMVVGYDTDEYYYEPGDIAWAKCYELDLEAENGRLEAEAMTSYLDSLAGEYLTRTHRLTWSESGKTYEITAFTAEEKKANTRAEALFCKDQASMKKELGAMAKEMGFSQVNQQILDYAEGLRQKLIRQRQCLTEFYRLAGLGTVEGVPKEAWLLEQEGYLIQASYTSALEQILVELTLSDAAIQRMEPSRQEEYLEYQKQMKEAAQLNNRGSESGPDTKEQDKAADRAAMEQMSFYQQVLKNVREEYESEHGEGSWDDCLLELLKGISPDCAVNQQEEGIRQLCQLAGISAEVTDMAALSETVSGLHRVRELEEVIVAYKLQGAAYQSQGYREAYQAYTEGIYGSEAEKDAAFLSAGFYQIIADLQKQNEDALSNTTWEQKMKDILGMCGAGIVLTEEAAE